MVNAQTKDSEIRVEIGTVCVSFKIARSEMRRRFAVFYKDYISDKRPSVRVKVEQKGFLRPGLKTLIYKTKNWGFGSRNDRLFLYFWQGSKPSLALFDGQLNSITFYTEDEKGGVLCGILPRLIFSMILPASGSLMLHACGVSYKKRGYLFVAASGGGKSTIARLALESGLCILNDDKIIICKDSGTFTISGNPWHGDVAANANKSVPIREVFFLKKHHYHRIVRMSRKASFFEFMKNNFTLPAHSDIISTKNEFCLGLSEKIDCYYLYFKPDISLWRFLDEFSKRSTSKKRKSCLADHRRGSNSHCLKGFTQRQRVNTSF